MIAKLVEGQQYEMVELKIGGSAQKAVIQVFIDQEGGVTIKDCVALTRRIRFELDLVGDSILTQDYRLEVSSPGVDRKLTTPGDFMRNIGRDIVLQCLRTRDCVLVQGTLIAADDSIFRVRTRQGEEEYQYTEIQSASIQLKWK